MRKSQLDIEAAAIREAGDYEAYSYLCQMNGIEELVKDRFWNGATDTLNDDPAAQADEKLSGELAKFNAGGKAKAVSSHVARALKNFSKQSSIFAAAVLREDRNLSDCCKEIMQGVGNSISDIEVYRRAVKYYMPGAKVTFSMDIQTVSVAGEPEGTQAEKVTAAPAIQISLFGEEGQ